MSYLTYELCLNLCKGRPGRCVAVDGWQSVGQFLLGELKESTERIERLEERLALAEARR